MKLHDLVTIHYFHDCILNNVQYDPEQWRLEISLDFCKWMQDYFVEGMPEVIVVKLVFTNVSRYFDDELGEVDSMYYEVLNGDPILDESGVPVVDDAGNMGVSFFIDRGFEDNNRINLNVQVLLKSLLKTSSLSTWDRLRMIERREF